MYTTLIQAGITYANAPGKNGKALSAEVLALHSLADRRSLPTTLKKTMALCIVVQAETGSHMSEWLDSPGLQPPK